MGTDDRRLPITPRTPCLVSGILPGRRKFLWPTIAAVGPLATRIRETAHWEAVARCGGSEDTDPCIRTDITNNLRRHEMRRMQCQEEVMLTPTNSIAMVWIGA